MRPRNQFTRTLQHEALHAIACLAAGGSVQEIIVRRPGLAHARLTLPFSPGEVARMGFTSAVQALADVTLIMAAPAAAHDEHINPVDEGVIGDYARAALPHVYEHAWAVVVGRCLPAWLKLPKVRLAAAMVSAALSQRRDGRLAGKPLEAVCEAARALRLPTWREHPYLAGMHAPAPRPAPRPAPTPRRSPAPCRQVYVPPLVQDYRGIGYSVIAASWWPWRKAQGTALDRRPLEDVLSDLLRPHIDDFDPEGWTPIPPGMLGDTAPPGRAGGPRRRIVYGPPPARRQARVELPPMPRPRRPTPASWRQHGKHQDLTPRVV